MSEAFLSFSVNDLLWVGFALFVVGIPLAMAAFKRRWIFAPPPLSEGEHVNDYAEVLETRPIIIFSDKGLALRSVRSTPDGFHYFDEFGERGIPIIENKTAMWVNPKLAIYSRDPQTGRWRFPKWMTYEKEREAQQLEQIALLTAENIMLKSENEEKRRDLEDQLRQMAKLNKEVGRSFAPTNIYKSGTQGSYRPAPRGDEE